MDILDKLENHLIKEDIDSVIDSAIDQFRIGNENELIDLVTFFEDQGNREAANKLENNFLEIADKHNIQMDMEI